MVPVCWLRSCQKLNSIYAYLEYVQIVAVICWLRSYEKLNSIYADLESVQMVAGICSDLKVFQMLGGRFGLN